MADDKKKLDRREFFKKAGGVLGSAGVMAVASTGNVKASDASVTIDKTKSKGYEETEHVRTYYDVAGF